MGMAFEYEVDSETFAIELFTADGSVRAALPLQERAVEDYRKKGEEVSWRYQEDGIAVSVSPEDDYLSVMITSETDRDNAFTWPEISAYSYYFPFGEGKRVPADNSVWKDYLAGQIGQPASSFPADFAGQLEESNTTAQVSQPNPAGQSYPADQSNPPAKEFSVLEQFSMPFWISSAGDYAVLFIMEDPFHTKIGFRQNPDLTFSLNNEFPAIDTDRTKQFRIYLTDNDPVSAAKLYRKYVRETDWFITLEQKAESNPMIRKLYGAPFIYLWGERLISPEDVNWPAFRTAIGSLFMNYLTSFSSQVENGNEIKAVLDEIQSQDYVADYQKHLVCSYLSGVLKLPEFYSQLSSLPYESFYTPSTAPPDAPSTAPSDAPSALWHAFTTSSPELTGLLNPGYEKLKQSHKIQVNKYLLYANLLDVFGNPSNWMEQDTVDLIRQLKASGISQAWIGLNNWEQAYAKPALVEEAVGQGYLISSYDSYHSIHEPGNEQWVTARFGDTSLYDRASLVDRNGGKLKGFQGVGRKLNPVLSLPAVRERMLEIMGNGLPFNSWFIDCDATGEVYDDYAPGHITTQQQDLAARLERMAYIRDTYGMVIGSEGGHDFAASTIAFAHGIEMQSFSWMDDDMKENRDSEYFIGKYYNPDGGVAEHFSRRIPVKSRYRTLFTDPRYDVPLYKLVYNDSVITSYHWDWSTFKIKDQTGTRMLREILYNVPPLYHLDAAQWEKYKDDIVRHNAVWSEFSRNAVTQEMTGFRYLKEDGSVQMTEYGNGIQAAANFNDEPFIYGNQEIPGKSVLIRMDGKETVYTPKTAPDNA
ncbi:MAG: molecular chaperone GroEL [Enterocloster citroniae]|nr:molecular chaperone GroEL [Enterocloster citroniae]